MPRFLYVLFLPLILAWQLRAETADIYAKSNLAAWCIVPFDAKNARRRSARRWCSDLG